MDDLAATLAAIAKRQRRLGLAYKLGEADTDTGLALDVVTVAGVDLEKMSATAIITTPAVDRVGEVVMPDGGYFTDYARNPVVLWNHGFTGLSMPIAKCEGPDGKLALNLLPDAIEGTSYFTTITPESYQIFGLIAEEIIRATSIHFEPVAFKREQGQSGDEVTIFTAWKLREWSWCDIGCNPEAVRKALDRGRIGEDAMLPAIAKMLRPHAPIASKSAKKGTAMPTNPTKPASPNGKPTKAKADPPEDEELPDEEAGDEADTDLADEEKGEAPYGAQLLAAAYQGLAQIKAALDAGLKNLEQPDVKGYAEALSAELESRIAETEGCYSKQYPDAPALKTDEPEPSDAAVKRWIAASKYKGLLLVGIATRLAAIAAAKGLTAAERKQLAGAAKSLKQFHAEATKPAAPAKPEPAIDPEVAKRLGALADKLAKVGEGIETATSKL
jgi:hypothetical protein